MNHFLKNLITRHQANGSNLQENRIVQPRPKYRFENAANYTSLGQTDSGFEEIITSSSEQSSNVSKTPAHLQTNADQTNTSSGTFADNKNEFSHATPRIFKETPLIRESTTIFSQNNNFKPTHFQTETAKSEQKGPGLGELNNNQKLSIPDEFQPRVQTILHRINSLQSEYIKHPSTIEIKTGKPVAEKELAINEELPVMSEKVTGLEVENSESGGNNEIGPEQNGKRLETHQSGLLQTPDWLTQIQSELNQQQQKMNVQKDTSPVVNVTIGRVEVKAVKPDAENPIKPGNKPSGIMNLEDYLKQRDKGRA